MDLFSPPPPEPARPAEPRVFSVSDLAGGLKALVENEFGDVWVEGELSNFKRHTSGHCYFTLKDSGAQLRCVMWRHYTQYIFFKPADGMLVRIRGQVSIYESRGDLQLVARSMKLAGEGALQKAFEELKKKLAAEGLFDRAHKKSIPPYPETIGVVTSGDGAALRDILSILQRRFPQVRVLVCPVQVQGIRAAETIAGAVAAFNEVPIGDPLRADVLIVGRGGGSAEDLWAFNEEAVARAIHASAIPVISAVGHETDHSIADYVADVRAATPSMAAELAVPDRNEVAALIRGLDSALKAGVSAHIRERRQRVRSLTASYAFRRPIDHLRRNQQRLDELIGRLNRGLGRTIEGQRGRCTGLQGRLMALDPMRPLRRGYVCVERAGRPVREAASLGPGDAIALYFHDGRRDARVE